MCPIFKLLSSLSPLCDNWIFKPPSSVTVGFFLCLICNLNEQIAGAGIALEITKHYEMKQEKYKIRS